MMNLSLHLMLVSALFLSGCTVASRLQSTFGNKYRYSATMVAPAKSREMLFRDDNIIIQFRLTEPALRFQLQNISPVDLNIDWQHASLGIHGNYSRVRTTASLYDSAEGLPPSQKVPSLGVIRDLILPRGNLFFDGRQWQRDDLLPTTDANSRDMGNTIRKLTGSSIDVNMPIDFSGEARMYHFAFVIDSVTQMAWSSYQPPRWFPAPPPLHGLKPTTADQIAAAILVGGFIGFLSYIVIAKKTPISE